MILVTGGTGFLGQELIHQLLAAGKQVRVMYRSEDRLSVLQPFLRQIETVQADLLDTSALEIALKGVTEVYHCAANTSFLRRDDDGLMKVNVEGTANLVNAMLHFGVPRLLFVSSVYAYGTLPGKPVEESIKWEKTPFNTRYGLSKMLAEREVWRGQEEGLQTMIVQPGVIIGPGTWGGTAISEIIKVMEKGFPFYFPGRKGYVDVRDVAEVMIRLMELDACGEKFIVVSENIDTKALLEKLAVLLEKPAPGVRLPAISAPLIALADSMISLLTGRERRFALSNLRISLQAYTYSNEKIKGRLSYNFRSVSESLEHLVALYKEEQPFS
jgi:dihydroflavonol-4-reductase